MSYSLFQTEVAFLLEKSVYPRLHDPDPGPQEKSTEKSCISFGKGCTIRRFCMTKTYETKYVMLVDGKAIV